jgi:hypothetical protein
MNGIAKLYDKVLAGRFEQWYRPMPEQAGAQKERGCAEQIAALRLLIDTARSKKLPLFITFVDYEKAFDRVSRQTLINLLAEKGCGSRFLSALAKSLEKTVNLIGKETLNTFEGVKQGGATSCSLFTFYLDHITARINTHGEDDYLKDLHCLLLMDDTAIVATSRQAMQAKLNILVESSQYLNMKLHPTKCEYISINADDTTPFYLTNCQISHTTSYKYLGSIISNNTYLKQLEDHAQASMKHVNKYNAFTYKHNEAPFWIKKRVLESCVRSTLFYSSESWLTNQIKPITKLYTSCIKQLLGVRNQTAQDVVLAETGFASANAIIKQRQAMFYKNQKMKVDTPLAKAMKIAEQQKTPSHAYITSLIQQEQNFIDSDISLRKTRMLNSQSTKVQAYLTINPELKVHSLYSPVEDIPEYARTSLTRFRTSSHYLKIETGRWSRVARENRTCQCQESVQSEEHVVTACPLTLNMHPNFRTLKEAMNHAPKDLAMIVHKILEFFKNYEG